jgi:hypothetical protein
MMTGALLGQHHGTCNECRGQTWCIFIQPVACAAVACADDAYTRAKRHLSQPDWDRHKSYTVAADQLSYLIGAVCTLQGCKPYTSFKPWPNSW